MTHAGDPKGTPDKGTRTRSRAESTSKRPEGAQNRADSLPKRSDNLPKRAGSAPGKRLAPKRQAIVFKTWPWMVIGTVIVASNLYTTFAFTADESAAVDAYQSNSSALEDCQIAASKHRSAVNLAKEVQDKATLQNVTLTEELQTSITQNSSVPDCVAAQSASDHQSIATATERLVAVTAELKTKTTALSTAHSDAENAIFSTVIERLASERDKLKQAITAADSAFQNSDGKTMDNKVRDLLASTINNAKTVLANCESQPSTLEDADKFLADVQATAKELTEKTSAVTQSHDEWQKAEGGEDSQTPAAEVPAGNNVPQTLDPPVEPPAEPPVVVNPPQVDDGGTPAPEEKPAPVAPTVEPAPPTYAPPPDPGIDWGGWN